MAPEEETLSEDIPAAPFHPVEEQKEEAASKVAKLLVWIFAGTLLLSFCSPILSYYLVMPDNPKTPVNHEQTIVALKAISMQALEFIKIIGTTCSALLAFILGYYFKRV